MPEWSIMVARESTRFRDPDTTPKASQPSFDQLPSKQQYKAYLTEEIAAMRLAHKGASEQPFDNSAAKLLKKIEAAVAKLDKL